MHMTVKIWESGDTVFGRVTLPLRGGSGAFSVLLSLSSRQVLQYLHAIGLRLDKQQAQQIGSLFGGMGKFLKKVAKNSVLKGVLNVAKGVAGSPLLKMLAPQAALAIEAASGAAKLIKAAKSGNPKAKLAMKAALAQADLETQQGQQLPVPTGVAAKGPETAMAFRYLVTVHKAAAV
jgi:hypothetical protein